MMPCTYFAFWNKAAQFGNPGYEAFIPCAKNAAV